jgi:hypothetical protein
MMPYSQPQQQLQGQFSVRDLANTMHRRSRRQQECYAEVLERCYSRIRRCAAANRFEYIYEVPDMIVGMPLFDLNRCVRVVMRNLLGNGFQVAYYFPRFLHVSWRAAAAAAAQRVAQEDGDVETLLQAQQEAAMMQAQQEAAMLQQQQVRQLQQQQSMLAMPSFQYPQPSSPFFQPNQPQLAPGRPPLQGQQQQQRPSFRPIADFKPNGKFVLTI